eukprot:7513704-Heterocapsa_arctica.AAC.1
MHVTGVRVHQNFRHESFEVRCDRTKTGITACDRTGRLAGRIRDGRLKTPSLAPMGSVNDLSGIKRTCQKSVTLR